MKVIILLAGRGTRLRPLTWSRPKALLNVAGKKVIGHVLDFMSVVTGGEVVFVVGYQGEMIAEWVGEHYPQLDAHFVRQEEALGQAHAIWQARDFLDDEDVLVAYGDGIVEADYGAMPDPAVDVVSLAQEIDDPRPFGVAVAGEDGLVKEVIEKPQTAEHKLTLVGVHWFRRGSMLRRALETVLNAPPRLKGEYYLADALQLLLAEGRKMITKPVTLWLDAGNRETLMATNRRLLGLGYGSEDAIERSYIEDFTVLPPVFIHETAVIESSVIGPFANIEARAIVRDSIIRNSIIDAGAQVERVILEGALVGENVRVNGRFASLFAGDNSAVEVK